MQSQPRATQHTPMQSKPCNILHRPIQLQMATTMHIHIRMTKNKMHCKAQKVKIIESSFYIILTIKSKKKNDLNYWNTNKT